MRYFCCFNNIRGIKRDNSEASTKERRPAGGVSATLNLQNISGSIIGDSVDGLLPCVL